MAGVFKLGAENVTTIVGGNVSSNATDGSVLSQEADNINAVFTALVVNTLIGAACLFGFLVLRTFMKQYQLRLHLPSITLRPPPLPTKGLGKVFGWLGPVFTTSDAFILRAAGLDALVLQKAMTIGFQICAPIAAVACCLLLPLQISQAYYQGDASYGRVTMANIWPGSSIMWAHWACCLLFLGWTFLLLEYHTRQYAAVRQHYLRGGDDPNYWRDLHMAEADGAHVHRSAKLVDVLGAARLGDMLEAEEAMLEAHVSGRAWWQRAMRSITSWTGQEDVSQAAIHQDRRTAPSGHVDLAHDVIQGDFVRDAQARQAPGLGPPAGEAAAAADAADAAAAAPPAGGGGGGAPGGGASNGLRRRGASSEGEEVILTVPNSAVDMSRAAGGGEGEDMGGRQTTLQDEQARRLDGEDVGSLVAHKWWCAVEVVGAAGGRLRKLTSEEAGARELQKVMLAKPSVRYRKTINTYDKAGRRTAVNAQQYAVLVTNVNQACYPEFMVGKHSVPGAGKCGNLAPDAMPPAVKYELEGKLAGHAEALPSASDAAGGGSKDADAMEAGAGRARSGAELWALVRRHAASGVLAALGRSQAYSLVASVFSSIFPADFDRVVPVFNYRRVDLLMRVWDVRQGQLEAARWRLERSGERPKRKTKCCGGQQVDAIDWLEAEIARLEPLILKEREAALRYGQTPSWFVLFRSQTAAAIASSCNILPMNQDLFQVHPAPGPEEVNWESLWFNHRQRTWRGWLTAPAAVVVVLLPVSLLTSVIATLNTQFCAAVNFGWYCNSADPVSRIAKGLITGFLPSLLITLWQGLALPRLVYMIAQSEGRHYSLSSVDRRMGEIYFLWDVFNFFAQGVLGSAAVSTAAGAATFQKTGEWLNQPEQVPSLLGQALPSSSKFFFTYIIMRTLMTVPLRFLITQPGVWQCWLRLLDVFSKDPPPRTQFMRLAIRSPRYGVEFGSLLLILLISTAFAIISPLIALFGAAFCGGMWIFWRYQLLYNYQRKYEAGGLLWQFYVNRILVCCAIMVAFTGCVMVVKRAFAQASLLWVGGLLFIVAFQHRINRRYMNAIVEMPLYLAQMAPRARVPSSAYIPPPLQSNGLGWYPEHNKVWEWFGMPGYSY